MRIQLNWSKPDNNVNKNVESRTICFVCSFCVLVVYREFQEVCELRLV